MTDLAPYVEQQSRPLVLSSIRETAQDLSDAHTIAKALCVTQFAPAHFRGKPEEAAAAILYGQTIGMDPLTALQNIYSIGSKPALYARAMVAVVLSKGHEVWTEEETPELVVVCGKRRGSTHIERSEWSADRARQAGYTSNAQYTKNPQDMLYARASGTVARRIAPDALLGMAYTAEELILSGEVPAQTSPAAPRKATGLDALRAATGVPTHITEEPVEATVIPDEPALITQAQTRALHASFGDAGISDREARLDYCTNLLGREIESSKELTRDEASRVIAALEADAQDGDGGAS